MGKVLWKFNPIRIVDRPGRHTQAFIAYAAAVIVHWLVRPLAAEANDRTSGASRSCPRSDDFDPIIWRDILEKLSHCVSPLTPHERWGRLASLQWRVFAMHVDPVARMDSALWSCLPFGRRDLDGV